jgi:hypothetical protein
VVEQWSKGVTTTVTLLWMGLYSLQYLAASPRKHVTHSPCVFGHRSGRVSVPRAPRTLAAVQCRRAGRARTVVARAALKALVFDCDGKIIHMYVYDTAGQRAPFYRASNGLLQMQQIGGLLQGPSNSMLEQFCLQATAAVLPHP